MERQRFGPAGRRVGDFVASHGWLTAKNPAVTEVVKLWVIVPEPVVGSAKNWPGSGPIIRSCAFVTETDTSAIVKPGGSPASTWIAQVSGDAPAFLTCTNVY